MESENLPIAFLVLGAGAFCAYMAMRPWPSQGGSPVSPAAYAVDILRGTPPPSPDLKTLQNQEVSLIQAGLYTIAMIWVFSKLAGIGKNIAEAADDAKQTVFGWWGNLF